MFIINFLIPRGYQIIAPNYIPSTTRLGLGRAAKINVPERVPQQGPDKDMKTTV
ncbi:hypothetical protein [Nitrosopumilus sp.]|uniref:hypothetical protein n=1 Tax=Nitrosopumilus sp. TaxID=2024843 RepID=UPI002931E0A8|nr:hypothetical protein [Nitrosopumilus sp.]